MYVGCAAGPVRKERRDQRHVPPLLSAGTRRVTFRDEFLFFGANQHQPLSPEKYKSRNEAMNSATVCADNCGALLYR